MDRNNPLKALVILPKVALRKESVDRNVSGGSSGVKLQRSLSARRAWIEIIRPHPRQAPAGVALRKESVDRNLLLLWRLEAVVRRSPQGERG